MLSSHHILRNMVWQHSCQQRQRLTLLALTRISHSQKSENRQSSYERFQAWKSGLSKTVMALSTGFFAMYFFGTYDKAPSITERMKSFIPKVNAADGDSKNSNVSLRQKYNYIADVVEKVSPAVVHIKVRSRFKGGAGSGFLISSDGLIVTNAHVVRSTRNSQVEVELADGRTYTGVVQVYDNASDLALVKIDDVNLPTIKLGSSETLRPGELVIAVGAPLTLSNTVTSGIISSTKRTSTDLGLDNGMVYIQTDAPITFGNSGGPLINLDGEAVGVNSMKVADGISFAIPSDYVNSFLKRADAFKKAVEAKRKAKPAYIGISMLTLNPQISAQLRSRLEFSDLDVDYGVLVVRVDSASPAAVAGIQKLDIVTKVDGSAVSSTNDLVKATENKTQVTFTIFRLGQMIDIVVKPR